MMGTAARPAGAGWLQLRGMISLEPWTIPGCGYPDLLATGETCTGQPIHDRQHPHDLFMELAAIYDRPLGDQLRIQLYGGPVGEPALGPPAFPHRVSAITNPLAPITHHWFDSTHVTFGVVTGGVYSKRWKAETSIFNGREPDEERTNVDFAALDSWSGRFWLLPTARWALQASAGRLIEAEPGHDGGQRTDITRLTVSATYHRLLRTGSVWANTAGWGRNAQRGTTATHALFAETNVTLDERDAWFGRVEVSGKPGHDLALETDETFTLVKFEAGYTRYGSRWNGLKPGIGAGLTAGIVPGSLKPVYGRRVNYGFAVFITVRPTEHTM